MHDIEKLKCNAYKLLLWVFGIHCIASLQSKSHCIVNKIFDTDGIIMMFTSSVTEWS